MKKGLKYLTVLMLMAWPFCATQCNFLKSDKTQEENESVPESGNNETTSKEIFHDYVDLGLPSGTLWATCNVGAKSPEEFGDYFAWGETTPKSIYSYETYKHCFYDSSRGNNIMDHVQFTKYSESTNKTILLPDDDAAFMNWGDDWCMPTMSEFEELERCCRKQVAVRNDVKGCLFVGQNGNSLFLPAAGCRTYESAFYQNDGGCYWSASLPLMYGGGNYYDFGGCYDLEIDDPCDGLEGRDVGRTIRPVYSSSTHNRASGNSFPRKISVERLTIADLDLLSAMELTYLRNEAYAVHGYVFKSQELNNYFAQFDWYHPDSRVSSSELNSIEQMNVAFIKDYQEKNNMMYKPH